MVYLPLPCPYLKYYYCYSSVWDSFPDIYFLSLTTTSPALQILFLMFIVPQALSFFNGFVAFMLLLMWFNGIMFVKSPVHCSSACCLVFYYAVGSHSEILSQGSFGCSRLPLHKLTFKDHYEEMIYTLHPRDSVIENVEKMINCGNPAFGGAMYGCPHCGKLKFVPFGCHSRFCPTCETSMLCSAPPCPLNWSMLPTATVFLPLIKTSGISFCKTGLCLTVSSIPSTALSPACSSNRTHATGRLTKNSTVPYHVKNIISTEVSISGALPSSHPLAMTR